MHITINHTRLELVQGNIVQQDVDAIVNAANRNLAGGSGVDGAIHHAGGPQIMEECRRIGGCPPGQAVITTGGNLKARYVIHTVGPIYSGGFTGEAQILINAYNNSLKIAVENDLRSIAFPSISTGAYRYPLNEAAGIAVFTVKHFLEMEQHNLELVRFVLFDEKTLATYGTALRNLESKAQEAEKP